MEAFPAVLPPRSFGAISVWSWTNKTPSRRAVGFNPSVPSLRPSLSWIKNGEIRNRKLEISATPLRVYDPM